MTVLLANDPVPLVTLGVNPSNLLSVSLPDRVTVVPLLDAVAVVVYVFHCTEPTVPGAGNTVAGICHRYAGNAYRKLLVKLATVLAVALFVSSNERQDTTVGEVLAPNGTLVVTTPVLLTLPGLALVLPGEVTTQ